MSNHTVDVVFAIGVTLVMPHRQRARFPVCGDWSIGRLTTHTRTFAHSRNRSAVVREARSWIRSSSDESCSWSVQPVRSSIDRSPTSRTSSVALVVSRKFLWLPSSCCSRQTVRLRPSPLFPRPHPSVPIKFKVMSPTDCTLLPTRLSNSICNAIRTHASERVSVCVTTISKRSPFTRSKFSGLPC